MPQNISKVVSLYLSLPHCYLEPEITGKRVNRVSRYGLEIPGRFCFNGLGKAAQWLEMTLKKIEEQVKESVNYGRMGEWFCDNQYYSKNSSKKMYVLHVNRIIM